MKHKLAYAQGQWQAYDSWCRVSTRHAANQGSSVYQYWTRTAWDNWYSVGEHSEMIKLGGRTHCRFRQENAVKRLGCVLGS